MTLTPARTLARTRALHPVDSDPANPTCQPYLPTLPANPTCQPYPPTLPPNPTPQPYPPTLTPTPTLHQCAAEAGAALLSLAASTEPTQQYAGTEAGAVLLVDR
jgi:hypothetical protein